MASPFPGMDPYLEACWGDVHHRLITYLCDQLQPRLPRDLRARVQERVLVDAPGPGDRGVYPDIRIIERSRGRAKSPPQTGELAVAEPLIITLSDDPVTEGFIEIIDLGTGRQVVTLIEILSMSNKRRGPGQELFRQKQEEAWVARVSLVEIDLLRRGRRAFCIPAEVIPESHRTAYQVVVRRGWRPFSVEVYRAPLRERLPIIRVPLRETDEDVPLDLQAALIQAYANGGYDDDLDYDTEPDPRLKPADAKWADALLRSAGLRKARRRRKS
jgi:hypothetical protein